MIFQQGGHHTGQRQRAPVERVQEARLAFGIFVAQVQTVGLIGFEIRHRAHLQPAFLRGAIHLEIEGERRREADVAPTQPQHAVGEFEFFEKMPHMGTHFVQHLIGILGFLHTHNLHLVKLMQTVQAAHVLAVGTGLATETGRIGAVLYGQILFLQDAVAVEVGDGHFGGGNHIEIVQTDMIHLRVLVGKLAGAVARSLVHHQGRFYLHITGFIGAVEEKVYQCPLQARTLAFVNRETRTGNLVAEFKIDDVVFGGQFPVGKRVFGQRIEFAHLTFHHVVGGVLAFGNRSVGRIRDAV